MSFYEKILVSTYSSFERTNKIDPDSATVLGFCILHLLNIHTLIMMGYDMNSIGRLPYLVIAILSFIAISWFHEVKFNKERSLYRKSKKLNSKSKFWYGLLALLYELATFRFLFWQLNANMEYFYLICIVSIGTSFISFIFRTKTNGNN